LCGEMTTGGGSVLATLTPSPALSRNATPPSSLCRASPNLQHFGVDDQFFETPD
jgi:hypothetical protein